MKTISFNLTTDGLATLADQDDWISAECTLPILELNIRIDYFSCFTKFLTSNGDEFMPFAPDQINQDAAFAPKVYHRGFTGYVLMSNTEIKNFFPASSFKAGTITGGEMGGQQMYLYLPIFGEMKTPHDVVLKTDRKLRLYCLTAWGVPVGQQNPLATVNINHRINIGYTDLLK